MNENWPQGEKSPHSKFTEKEIVEIIEKVLEGAQIKDVTKEYGISQCYLSRLMKRQNWKCIQHPGSRIRRWREWLKAPEWQGKKRNPYYIHQAIQMFDDSFKTWKD